MIAMHIEMKYCIVKECFRYVRYGAKFKKLCEGCDVLIDNGCL